MNIETRKKLERRIVKKVVETAIKLGYSISLDNGGDDFEFENSIDKKFILSEMFATDDEHLFFYKDGKQMGWIWFVYGNDGYDVMCDMTTLNIKDITDPAEQLADKLCEQYA